MSKKKTKKRLPMTIAEMLADGRAIDAAVKRAVREAVAANKPRRPRASTKRVRRTA